ncbi:MAG: hypothetical protein KatS3mg121_1072 [Gammaproteobacteria bacterium]|nr:MAG: hypothetical protein KatS3mg121_1072 [Gammaproteobacteria bacterium]
MDVFALQDRARRSSRLLVALYLLLVVALIAAVDQLLRLAIGVEPGPALRGAIAGGLALLILGGSLWRLQQLRRWGGAGVLTALGARRVTAADPDPLLKRLHNVVEEMAIAAGLPVPAVYLIDDSAINALAAGFGPQDAAIGVTRGALELLDRDELQGVVAHEFAHILNGDMRLNLRLIGLQHGLLMLQLLGRHLALAAPRARRQAAGLYALGFALQTLGLLGAIAGGLLRAAVSRQREFLADAAAVQFTRQPQGIAGALKKIGGWVVGSRLGVPGAQALAHCFIAEAVGRLSSGLLATHPPLSRRIRRLDPHWDGRYPSVQREPRRAAAAPAAGRRHAAPPAPGGGRRRPGRRRLRRRASGRGAPTAGGLARNVARRRPRPPRRPGGDPGAGRRSRRRRRRPAGTRRRHARAPPAPALAGSLPAYAARCRAGNPGRAARPRRGTDPRRRPHRALGMGPAPAR